MSLEGYSLMDTYSSDLQTHASLLWRLRDHTDHSAWQAFSETYAGLIYRRCRRYGLQEADAADVTQEVLAQVARSIKTFEYQPARGRFRDWLGAVVRSKISRHHRRRESRHESAATESTVSQRPDADADTAWVAEFNAHLIRVAMDRVRLTTDETYWRAFELTWVRQQAAAEVAGVLGLAVSAVYVAKSRVLKRLREEIAVLAEDVPHLVLAGDADRLPR